MSARPSGLTWATRAAIGKATRWWSRRPISGRHRLPGSQSAERLRLIERFTRVAADKVMWAVTVDDPKTWTRPWTFAVPLTMDDDEPIFEYACHEGNYGLRNILSAARAEEKIAEEDAKNGIVRAAARPGDGGEDAER